MESINQVIDTQIKGTFQDQKIQERLLKFIGRESGRAKENVFSRLFHKIYDGEAKFVKKTILNQTMESKTINKEDKAEVTKVKKDAENLLKAYIYYNQKAPQTDDVAKETDKLNAITQSIGEKVNPSLQLVLAQDLDEKALERVVKYIGRESGREKHTAIGKSLYRIKEQALSIFGKSNAQFARKALVEKVIADQKIDKSDKEAIKQTKREAKAYLKAALICNKDFEASTDKAFEGNKFINSGNSLALKVNPFLTDFAKEELADEKIENKFLDYVASKTGRSQKSFFSRLKSTSLNIFKAIATVGTKTKYKTLVKAMTEKKIKDLETADPDLKGQLKTKEVEDLVKLNIKRAIAYNKRPQTSMVSGEEQAKFFSLSK